MRGGYLVSTPRDMPRGALAVSLPEDGCIYPHMADQPCPGCSGAELCRLLCCPAAGTHDRTHPLCVVMPLLWDGDQA